jgi:DNA end-binding protein Ku
MWSGTISFGLVAVPVKMYTAVRGHEVHFHQVDRKSGSRVRNQRVSEKTGREVDREDLALGYELRKGEIVVVDPGEIEGLRPRSTRTIDIADFVDLAEIDPAYYDRTYWLAPDGESASRPYHLLVAAMEERQRVGIGMVVMRNKQYLAAIRPREHALALSTMHFADEVMARRDVDGLKTRATKPDRKELDLATKIIDSMASEWQPKRYKDTYTAEVRQLIQAHEEGRDIVTEDEPEESANVTDLMAALEASLKAGRPKKATGRKKSA